MAGREGLRLAEANRPTPTGQAARAGKSGLALRLQLRRAQPDEAAEVDRRTTSKSQGSVRLKTAEGLGTAAPEAPKTA